MMVFEEDKKEEGGKTSRIYTRMPDTHTMAKVASNFPLSCPLPWRTHHVMI